MSNWLSLLWQSAASPSSSAPEEEKITCRQFLRGKCAHGDRCRHSHDLNGERFLGPGPILRCHICNSDLSSLDESDILLHVLDCCSAERHGAAPDDHDPFAVDCPYPGCGSRLEARNLPLHARSCHATASGSFACPVCALLSLHSGVLHDNLLQHLSTEHGDLLPTAAYSQAMERSGAASSSVEPDQPPPLKTRTLGVVNTRYNVSYIGKTCLVGSSFGVRTLTSTFVV